MADNHSRPQDASFWSGRTLEWVIAGIVILVLSGILLQRLRVVQGQVELAAVKQTLGALRTAFVLEHLRSIQSKAASTSSVPLTRNPFELLERIPLSYQGVTASSAEALRKPQGSWVFDRVCVCVGYRPLEGELLVSPSGMPIAWYGVQQSNDAAVPLLLVPKETYVWQGVPLN